ncbi:Glutathione S-transferase kappa 1, partial [Ophiophagus hannah]
MATARETSGVSKKKVECFYDVVSPYSWLGFEVRALEKAVLKQRPLSCALQGYVAQEPTYLSGFSPISCHVRFTLEITFCELLSFATGNQPPAMLPKRGEYLLKDVSRMAKYCQVPMNSPKDFVNTVIVKGSLPAMRFITAVDTAEPQFLESVSRELWMRIWSRDEDIVQPESILAAAKKAGLSSDKSQELLKMSTSPEIKNRLKETTGEVLKFGERSGWGQFRHHLSSSFQEQ